MDSNDFEIGAEIEKYMKNIKVEPEDESYEHVEPERQNDESIGSTERAVKRRKSKTDDYDSSFAASSSKRSNVCNSEPESNFNQIRNSYQSISSTSQSSSSHSSVSQRDPRLKKHLNGNSSEITTSPLTAANNANRKKFLDGILSTEDVLNLPATSSSNTHPQQIRKILSRTHEAKKLLNLSSTSSFYAKISDISLIPGGSNEQRSPMISSNNNAVFRSQATTSNIRESLIGKRYNNVPQELHSICQHLGVDIDALSQKMKPLRKETSETCFNENQRTIQTQTDKLGSSEPTGQSNVESNVDNKVDKEVQTEKNNGVFSIEISDLSKLTEEQRKGLIEFKRVMKLSDEPSTSSVLQRIRHRQANLAYEESRNGGNFSYNNGAGNSRDESITRFINPPAPTNVPIKPWINARPQ